MMKNFCCLLLLFPISFVCMAQEVEIRVHEVQRGESLEHVAEQDSLSMNPRGVYKLMGFGSPTEKKVGTSLDLYKICTDSVTLTLRSEGNNFVFDCIDVNTIYNYTGTKQGLGDTHATHIYNSNAQHFTLRYWDSLKDPLQPGEGQWREENYESGRFSYWGKILFDAIMAQSLKDNSDPVIGIWLPVGTKNDLQKGKEWGHLNEEWGKTKNRNSYCIVTQSHLITLEDGTGMIIPIVIKDKNTMEIGSQTKEITWFSQDRIAIKLQDKYVIWIRSQEQGSLLDRFTTSSFAKMLAEKGKARESQIKEELKSSEKRLVTKKIFRLLIKAKAKEFQNEAEKQGQKLAHKEAMTKSREYWDGCFEIMSSHEEEKRRVDFYDELCAANRLGSEPRLSDSDLRKIAFASEISEVPTHMINTAKHWLYGKKLSLF